MQYCGGGGGCAAAASSAAGVYTRRQQHCQKCPPLRVAASGHSGRAVLVAPLPGRDGDPDDGARQTPDGRRRQQEDRAVPAVPEWTFPRRARTRFRVVRPLGCCWKQQSGTAGFSVPLLRTASSLLLLL